jgi:hypothetical protein
VEVEAVEVDALPTFDLLDAEDLAFAELDCLANASRTSAARSGAMPRATVRSMSSSCC